MRRPVFIPAVITSIAVALLAALPASAESTFVKSVRFLPPIPWEVSRMAGKVSAPRGYLPSAVYADRKVYWNDDHVGQFLVTFLDVRWKDNTLVLEVFGDGPAPVVRETVGPMTEPKAALLLAVNTLKPGKYRLRASLRGRVAGAPPPSVEVAFERADKANPVVPFPADGVEVFVDPQPHLRDGTWPICAGIPFPQGTLSDVSKLAFFEDGREIPAQITQAATWHPEADGVKSSVSWAHLRFLARYAEGKPRAYRLRVMDEHEPSETPRIGVAAGGGLIIVDNGLIRFQVNAKSFRGVQAAWYDENGDGKYGEAEKVIDGPSGAYVVDAKGRVYEASADKAVEVVIEERGPVRVVIAAEGWYTLAGRPDAALCKFRTRIYAYAGEPMIRVQHHTILTFDSNEVQLADVGMRVPVQKARTWRMGVDGKTLDGALPASGSVYLHQYRWNRLRVMGAAPVRMGGGGLAAPSGAARIDGEKSDGWFTLTRESPASLTVSMRDIWQKFPKEVELAPAGFILHFWPKHGIDTFSKDERLAKANVYKLWDFHQGRLLDLKFLQETYQALKKSDEGRSKWDYEGMAEHAVSGNAQGVAIGNEYLLRFHSREAADAPARAALFQQDPLARSDPNWNAQTLVEGKISPYDPTRFPLLEQDIDTFHPDYMRGVVDLGTEYGMWIYANTHNHWDPIERQAFLHRVWQASHYRQVSTSWLLYFRGCSPDNLVWARANTDHFMDVDTVNYSSFAKDPHGNLRTKFKFHVPGAMYHAKGFTPWGATAYGEKTPDLYGAIWGHFINPDAYRFRYLIEGNGRAKDLYMLWADSIKTYDVPMTWGRDVNNTFGEILAYYTTTWDPDVMFRIHLTSDGMLSFPMDKMPAPYDHPGWHRFWHSRLYSLTRDERIPKSVLEYSKNYGRKFASMMAWDYYETGDEDYLQVSMPAVYDAIHKVYRNPGDPMSGYRDRFSAYGQFFYQEMPYWKQALIDAGIDEIASGDLRTPYLSHATHQDFYSEKSPALMLLAMEPTDREFTIRLESVPGCDVHPPLFRVISPSNKTVLEKQPETKRTTRYVGDKAMVVKVPKDGETGLYQIDFRNWGGLIFFAPFTDLGLEGTLLDRDVDYSSRGRCDMYLMPIGKNPRVKFEWKQIRYYGKVPVAYVRLEDAKGTVLLDTALLTGSKRETATFDLDAAKNPPPWRVFMTSMSGPKFRWSGTAKGLIAASSSEKVQLLAKEVDRFIQAAGKRN